MPRRQPALKMGPEPQAPAERRAKIVRRAGAGVDNERHPPRDLRGDAWERQTSVSDPFGFALMWYSPLSRKLRTVAKVSSMNWT